MINVSKEFRETMQIRTNYTEYAEVTLSNGSILTLDSSQFTQSNNSLSDGAGTSSFPLGVAIQKIAQIEVLNDAQQYANYDFFGAKIRLYIDFKLSSGAERIEKGTYTVITPETYGETVIITAYDEMYKADKDYSSNVIFPATAIAVLRDACDTCGITLGSQSFLHDDFVIQTKPTGITFRQLIGYISMIAGGNARIDARNKLQILTYNLGTFIDGEYHILQNWISPKIDYNDSMITGIQTVIKGETTEDDKIVMSGTDNYVLSIENPLISGQEDTVVSWLAELLCNFPFRPFSGDLVSDPTIEFMDMVKVVDRRGNQYNSFITDADFSIGGYTVLKNASASASRNSLSYPSAATQTEVKARTLIEKERTARELAIDALNQALAESSGMYSTYETQADGSTITYLHDKPTLEESKNVIKISAEAIGVSNDGGKTYPYGLQLDGTLIAKLLYTVGINADYINTGALSVKDDNGETIFLADINGKRVIINGDYVQIGGKSLNDALTDSTNMTMLLSNEYIGIPADYEGNVTVDLASSSDYATTITVYYGSSDVTAQSSITVKTSAGITGTLSGTQYTITNITTDTAWVDITAIYLNTLKITKRLNVAKVKSGENGQSLKILETEAAMTQEEIRINSTAGYKRNWTVITKTDELNINDTVLLKVGNIDQNLSDVYIMATVADVLSEYRLTTIASGAIESGAAGAAGRVYMLEPSTSVVKRGQDKLTTPDNVVFSAYYRDGESAERTPYSGRFLVEITADGDTWTTVYTSGKDETSCKYNFVFGALADSQGQFLVDSQGRLIAVGHDDTVMIRCTLYAAGGTTNSLDMQTVPIVIDIDALSTEDVFNLLTENGKQQGLFYDNGTLYLNGEFMKFVGAIIGGWNISEKAIYKDVTMSDGTVYRVYFQPPIVGNNAENTWILSCQKSTDGGKTFYGRFMLTTNGALMLASANSNYMTTLSPYDESNPDGSTVLAFWEMNDAGTALQTSTYISGDGVIHGRKLNIHNSKTYPHIIGDGVYLQMSPINNSSTGIVAEYVNSSYYLRPATSKQVGLGREAFLWGQVWSSTASISTSDRNEKHDIEVLDDAVWKQFFIGLKIVSYRLNDGTSNRKHHGMIAQDVEELLAETGIDSQDFAGFIKWQKTEQKEREETVIDEDGTEQKRKVFDDIPIYDDNGNPVYSYGLRYEEFLPMTIKAVQELYTENEQLTQTVNQLTQQLDALTQTVDALKAKIMEG